MASMEGKIFLTYSSFAEEAKIILLRVTPHNAKKGRHFVMNVTNEASKQKIKV